MRRALKSWLLIDILTEASLQRLSLSVSATSAVYIIRLAVERPLPGIGYDDGTVFPTDDRGNQVGIYYTRRKEIHIC